MSVFTEIKRQVKPKQAVRFYIGSPKRSGETDYYCSPFRQEKNPSFAVNDKKGITDFGSGRHYDVVSFVASVYNVKPLDAAKKIVSDFHLSVNDNPFDQIENISIVQINSGLEVWRNTTLDRLCILFRATQNAKKTLPHDSVGYYAACEFEGISDAWTDALISDNRKEWLQVYREIGTGVMA